MTDIADTEYDYVPLILYLFPGHLRHCSVPVCGVINPFRPGYYAAWSI